MNIARMVRCLRRRYNTSNPFVIANEMGILIIHEELGSINGYYNKVYRQKQIHINNVLNEQESLITASHELGHALCHPNANTPFLINNTLFSVDKLEIEANKFAAELLIDDHIINDFEGYTIDQIAKLLNLNKKLVNLKYYGTYYN